MSKSIGAVFEEGVFKPLEPVPFAEGQKVTISVEQVALTPAEVAEELVAWGKVYEGSSDKDEADIEKLALDRTHFVDVILGNWTTPNQA